jgi:hypothetical protein
VESLSPNLPPAEFLPHADALFRAAPVLLELGVFIWSPKDAVVLFDSPLLGRLIALNIFDFVSGQPTVEQLTSCAYLGRLTKLILCSPLLDDACVRTLANAALLEQLTDLSFFTWRWIGQSEWTRGTLGDEAARILAASPRCHNLMVLNLGDNRIGDAGAAALAASPHLAQLQTLVLSRNDVGPEGSALLKTQFGDRVHL